ncbi:hypothetical protein Tco_0928657, partial [Tanacetum coccineum]
MSTMAENVIAVGAKNRHPMPEKSQYDSWQSRMVLYIQGLVVPTFCPSDDLIESLNKEMAFISTSVTSRYPQTNNQVRTSSNLRNQATIQDGEGHVVKQYIQMKWAQNLEWFKEKMLLAEFQEAGVILDEEELAFLADTWERVDLGAYVQALTTTTIFQM